jgi:hypothetical protein
MSRGSQMGAEVGRLASKIGGIVGCVTCGIGLATEIVAARWGDPPYDWVGNGGNHRCELSRAGEPTPEQRTQIDELIASLGPVPQMPGPTPAPAGLVDSRLPVERDDDAEAPL